MEPHIVEEERPGEARQLLEDRINAHNVAVTGSDDGEVGALTIRDEAGMVAAGLFGWTWGGTLYVESLWVDEGRRSRGEGSRLLRTAERWARERS